MKTKFSKRWSRSKQPRKQRKYRANAPNHVKGKFMSAALSKDLRKKYGKRSLRLRKGDKVKIMRGKFRGETGEVERVDVHYEKVYITGLEVNRRDGSKSHPPIRPSNLMITDLDKSDRKRMEKLGEKPAPKTEEKAEKTGNKEEKKEAKKEIKSKQKTQTRSGSKKTTSKSTKKISKSKSKSSSKKKTSSKSSKKSGGNK